MRRRCRRRTIDPLVVSFSPSALLSRLTRLSIVFRACVCVCSVCIISRAPRFFSSSSPFPSFFSFLSAFLLFGFNSSSSSSFHVPPSRRHFFFSPYFHFVQSFGGGGGDGDGLDTTQPATSTRQIDTGK